MPNVLLVNNYTRNTSRISRLNQEIIRITGEKPRIIWGFKAPQTETNKLDAIILSGGDAPLNYPQVAYGYAETLVWLRHINTPILGICFGHQLLGLAFGGRIARMRRRFEGYYEIEVVEHDGLFANLPDRIRVHKSNVRVVARLMHGFTLLARSADYEVDAFRHAMRPIFGIQFHPEIYSDKEGDGRKVLENFLRHI
jgi:GMP synthase-like glutamine amidotransferase